MMDITAVRKVISELESELPRAKTRVIMLEGAIKALRGLIDVSEDAGSDVFNIEFQEGWGQVEGIVPGSVRINGRPVCEYPGLGPREVPQPETKARREKKRKPDEPQPAPDEPAKVAKSDRIVRGPKPASGHTGVYKRGNRFVAGVCENGKLRRLGSYLIAELAAAAVADEKGDAKEAARLRRIAAGQDPNPVTPADIARKAGHVVGSNDREMF